MSRLVPDRLTLMTGKDLFKTLVVTADEADLLVEATDGPTTIRLLLSEEQARKLRARIDKYFRENR